ncbi:MAG: alpha,alpha-trehalase TreF [Chitinophagaceae bacterium]
MAPIEIQNITPLFEDVQLNKLFPDGKTFVDCLPKFSPEEISTKYIQQKDKPGFNLQEFVLTNFELPVSHSNNYHSDTDKKVAENINKLWDVLIRQPDKVGGSLIPLPHSYIVPGGRFGEIYYWDSYFTMLGLKVSGKYDVLENMVNNFSYLIDTVGYIPNGNRSYFIGRSQPPFYSLMIKLLADIKGKEILTKYLPQLEKEYQFWMKGSEGLNESASALHRAVIMPGGEVMNRYWDENDSARPESYREDVELARESGQESKKVYRHLRAGAESGWDFSCRWFKDKDKFTSIHTADIVPVDLNCLLVHLEQTIAEAYRLKENKSAAKQYELLAEKRKQAVEKYCWNEELNFYVDYDFIEKKQKQALTLAGLFPLTFNIATEEQSKQVGNIVKEKFLMPGGVVTTLETTGQQWDAPNGWAPLQWMTIKGLENYGYSELAAEIAKRWINLNTHVFKRTGKLMEKYNVVDTHLEAGGGEYAGQDGFGWTNGVLLALIEKYGTSQ